MDAFAKQALEAHNKHRALHQSPPLTFSSGLAKEAQTWAEKIARERTMKHADTTDGENIFMAFGKTDYNGSEPVKKWYDEVLKYDFNKPGWQSGTGHFTQVVWKDSRELGIGKAKSADGSIFVVGRYRPAGNNLRNFADNVFPPKDGAPARSRGEPPSGGCQQQPRAGARRPQGHEEPVQERTETVTTYSADGRKTTVTRVTRVVKGQDDGTGALKNLPSDLRSGLAASKSTPSSGTSKSPSSEVAKGPLKDQALNAHNKYRAKHGSPALTWSDEIARNCQEWADKLAKANKLQHASPEERKGYGENIAMFTGKFENAGDEATSMWYSEVAKYDFKKSGFKSGTGHFTQVVWKGSTELGLARAKTSDGRATYVVARYKPAGNMLGDFDKNVFRAK